jgi:integrase
MPSIDWREFRADIEAVYSDKSTYARKTMTKMRQVCRELAEFVPTTADLVPAAIVDWKASRPGRTPVTTNSLLAYARTAARYAVDCGYLERSPFDAKSFRVRQGRKRVRRHLTRLELARLLAYLESRHELGWHDGRLHALAVLVSHTGLRAMEALRLRVEDLDLDRELLSVVARQGRLKTEGSEATIPIPPAAIGCLRRWRGRCGSDWLFPGARRKGPWVNGSDGKRPADFLNAAGVAAGLPPGTTLLMLRHTLATHARTHFHLDAKQVQQILRHSDERTQNHYIESDLDNLRQSVRQIDFRICG